MTIVKETLKNLLRRKWKLPLAVLLCGVALVVLHHAFDVDAMREAFLEARRESPASRSPEQTPLVTTWGWLAPLIGTLDAAFLIGPFLVGMLMPDGVVANERRSGAIMLWAQHPMPLSRFYMRRYLGTQIATLAALALIGVSAVLAFTLPPDTLDSMDRFAESCLAGLLCCAASFAISANGVRRAAFVVFAYFVGSNATMSPQLRGTPLGSSDVSAFLIFPTRPIGEFTMGFEADIPWNWGTTGIVVYHFALWTAIAWLGLRRLERKPLKL